MTAWGVFAWHPDPRYRASEAVKIYRASYSAERSAERFARRLNDSPAGRPPGAERGYVARPIDGTILFVKEEA